MEDVKVKIKRLTESARIPSRATDGSIAYDVVVPCDSVIYPGRQVIGLGFAIELPHRNYEAKIEPRSGFSSKGIEGFSIEKRISFKDHSIASKLNPDVERLVSMDSSRCDADGLIGKIDSDYRGEVGVIINSNESCEFLVKAGSRIAQMTIYEVPNSTFEEVRELSETARNAGGFGHTGSK